MKRIINNNAIYGLFVALFLLAGIFPSFFATLLPFGAAADNDDHKVTVCHVPPGNPENVHAIEIDRNAWENGHDPHNAHDMDYLADSNGSCDKQSQENPDFGGIGNCPNPLTNGDWSHQDGGTHHIPGQEAPIAGRDEVYRKGDNFLQCLCPSDANEMGYQTQWLRDVSGDQEGQDWNLIPGKYKTATSRFNCQKVKEAQEPSFPACPVSATTGDWVHSDSGRHHIPGQEATIEGRDDVYQLGDGNFLQCLCPKDGNGVRTVWWNIGSSDFKKDGWYSLRGGEWNLWNTNYLAKNDSYQCGGTPTSTPTPTATPAPQSSAAGLAMPQCVALSATVKSGSAPLSVMFTAEANDPNGKIEEYEFNFNDTSGGQGQYAKQTGRDVTHTFYNSGSFDVTAKARDNDGNWEGGDDCKVSIKVDGKPEVLGVGGVSELPKTGFFAPAALLSLPFVWVGVKVYKRFKLV